MSTSAGLFNFYTNSNPKDFASCVETGVYVFGAGVEKPDGPVPIPYGTLFVVNPKGNGLNAYTIKYFLSRSNKEVFIYDSKSSSWQRLDNFGYNSLAELSAGVANQVNPMMFKGDKIDLDTDLNSNEFLQTGWYILDGSSENSPVSNGLILLEVFNSMNESSGGKSISVVQKVTTLSTGIPNHYMRTKWGSWNDWKKMG